jgi:hypothetical protein
MKLFISKITLFLVLLQSCSLLEADYGTKKVFKGINLYYTKNVTELEVNKLGEYLLTKPGFSDGSKADIQLNKEDKTYEYRIPIKKGLEQDKEVIDRYKFIAKDLSKNVFNDSPVDVHLCDERLQTLRVVVAN